MTPRPPEPFASLAELEAAIHGAETVADLAHVNRRVEATARHAFTRDAAPRRAVTWREVGLRAVECIDTKGRVVGGFERSAWSEDATAWVEGVGSLGRYISADNAKQAIIAALDCAPRDADVPTLAEMRKLVEAYADAVAVYEAATLSPDGPTKELEDNGRRTFEAMQNALTRLCGRNGQ